MTDVTLSPSDINPGDVRRFANLPAEVPDILLTDHIAVARRALASALGVNEFPVSLAETLADTWTEALTVKALASVFPWLNTFALEGAAKVGRLEGSLEYRFLSADDVEARVEQLEGRFAALVREIAKKLAPSTDDDSGHVDAGAVSMMAI